MALMVEVVGRLGTISVSVSSLGTWATSPFLFGSGLGLEGCELDLQLIYWEGEELSSKDDFGGRHLGRVEEARVRTIEG